jgi:cytochrome c1
MPGETAADGGSNQKQTPGFEVIMFLGACMLVFILLKKQRR